MRNTLRLLLILHVSSNFVYAMGNKATQQFKDGDLIFQTSMSSQSQAIQLATRSKWSHMGVITYRNGVPYVYEARGPVGFRTLSAFISTGANGRYLVRRLRSGLNANQLGALKRTGAMFASIPYDPYFGWDNSRIYCSELPWKMFYKGMGVSIGKLEKLGDLDLSHPVVQAKLKERYGNNIPYEETVITPKAIAESEKFVTVFQN